MGMPFVQVTNNGTAAAGAQAPYNCDWMESPFECSYSVEIPSGGAATFTVETTLDDVNTVASASVVWNTVTASGTVNATGSLTTPVLFARVNYSAGPTTHPVTFRVIQGMSSR